MKEVKQVIVLRKDLNMRKGKMIAQGAHASLRAYFKALDSNHCDDAVEWERERSTKICVSVDSEKELVDVYKEAMDLGLPAVLIKDAGLTEFKEPTYTAVAIGPANSSVINKVTGTLKLL